MKITDLFRKSKKTYSFEFFPPKNYKSTLELGINVGQLLKLSPSFVSVTYGAGGSTQDLSFDLIDYIQNKIGLTAMAHYTCVNATRDKVEDDLNFLKSKNILNLMLLRGDPPKGASEFKSISRDFQHASDLIEAAYQMGGFSIGAAGYPEMHPESKDLDEDIKWLKYKIQKGAEFIITQMFFDNRNYFEYVVRARDAGITQKIIPGIIPIVNFKQIKRFSELSGAKIPEWIVEKMEPYQDDPAKSYQTGVDIAIQQCVDLLKRGAPGLHFYTLNKSRATVDIYSSLPHGLTN
ncbi:methylenetetrahydrofolate reductase [NAD(P)H] [Bacteroidota bacterium]